MKTWRSGLIVAALLQTCLLLAYGQAEAPSTTAQPADRPAEAHKPPASEKAKTEKEKREKEPYHLDWADTARVHFDTGIHELRGHVIFRQGETKLYCDEAIWNDEENTAKATGNLKIVDKDETTVTGDVINADFDKELAVISGSVVMVHQKKGEPPADATKTEKEKYKKTTLTCDKVEYYYGEGRAVATGNLKIVHEDKTVTGDVAVYLEKDEVATITGNVKLVDDKGRTMECEKATISTTEDWAEFEGVKGKWWKVEEEKEGEPQATASPAKPTSPATPTEPAAQPEQPPSTTAPAEPEATP
jgi:lipopolysaccharide assembly outer membrane protein LptD (OstA)